MTFEELYQGTFEENEDSAELWCYPDEHDMIDAGDNDSPYYMCTKCGFSANAYIVSNFMSEPLNV